jgi:hypothetical protein
MSPPYGPPGSEPPRRDDALWDGPETAQYAVRLPGEAPIKPAPAPPAIEPRPLRPAAGQVAQQGARTAAYGGQPLRRTRLVVRKIDPWAVLKFSLVFYFCMLVIALLATGIIFVLLKSFGVIANIESLFRSLELDVRITGGALFKWMFLIGLLGSVVASAITVFMAFLYNLIADVVGGIEIMVSEREPRR